MGVNPILAMPGFWVHMVPQPIPKTLIGQARRRSLINIRKYFLQHYAEDISDRNFQILENLETLPDPGNLIARQGNAGNLGSVLPLSVGSGSVLPLLLTSLLVAAISGTAAYTSLMANPPGEPKMISNKKNGISHPPLQP